MPVRNCCLGCQNPMCGPCGPMGHRLESCPKSLGPCCIHASCISCSPVYDGGKVYGPRGGVAGSCFNGGHGCIGGCTGGVCASCRSTRG